MKVRVCIEREIEIEVSDPAIAELDNYWRTHDWHNSSPSDDLVDNAVKAIENATGLPFSEDGGLATIVGVYTMDYEAILEA